MKPSQQRTLQQEIFPFAFEAFYNLQEKGDFSTRSTDVTSAFYYTLDSNTLIFGHGCEPHNAGYPFSDAGYIRTLVYGGIPLLLILIFYQSFYFSKPIKIAKSYDTREGRVDYWTFVLLFVYILALHVKDTALATQHISETMFLALGATYIVQHYSKQELAE
jgi:hypothetical protein